MGIRENGASIVGMGSQRVSWWLYVTETIKGQTLYLRQAARMAPAK